MSAISTDSTEQDVICAKVWLKPDSEARVREWAEYAQAHRDEAAQTLQDEGIAIESEFFDPMPARPCLAYHMRSSSQEHAMPVAAKSAHAIDADHQAFKQAAWTRVERQELLIDLLARPRSATHADVNAQEVSGTASAP